MLSLKVHFSQCFMPIGNPNDYNAVAVNHAMFYISDSKNKTTHRVDSGPGTNDIYTVRHTELKHDAARIPVGEGFEVNFVPNRLNDLSGADIADMLAEFPPPHSGHGQCQWWVLKNLDMLENDGLVKSGTTHALLTDERMNSKKLMEFEQLRNELLSGLRADISDAQRLEELITDVGFASDKDIRVESEFPVDDELSFYL